LHLQLPVAVAFAVDLRRCLSPSHFVVIPTERSDEEPLFAFLFLLFALPFLSS
jgi:hypothetical protein